jgi:hypothetical protein
VGPLDAVREHLIQTSESDKLSMHKIYFRRGKNDDGALRREEKKATTPLVSVNYFSDCYYNIPTYLLNRNFYLGMG